jgi:tetratricopeptide (TPR) repeat protein
MIKSITILEDLIPLEQPSEFHAWLFRHRQEGKSKDFIVEKVLATNHPVAFLRAAQICSRMGDYDNWYYFASCAARASDHLIRLAARLELAMHEVESCRVENPHVFEVMILPVEEYLLKLDSLEQRTELNTEIELHTLLFLADCWVQTKNYEYTRKYAGQAVILAKEIQLHKLRFAAYSTIALAELRSGDLSEAFTNYTTVASSDLASSSLRQFAHINKAVISNLLGDRQKALQDLQVLQNSNPENRSIDTVQKYIWAMLGDVPEKAVFEDDPSDSYLTQLRCLQLILSNAGASCQNDLNLIISVTRSWKPNSPLAEPLILWLQAMAFHKLNRPLVAARIIATVRTNIPMTQILIDGMRLELGIDFNGLEIENLDMIVGRIEKIFATCPNTQAREGLAAYLAFWHPKAAAFLAFSPIGISELYEFGSAAVFKDGRPITIYGQGVSSRLPFVQKTLEEFGFDVRIARDQSVELERLNKVLLQQLGERQHRLPVVPPALIAFQFFRLSETCGVFWKRAALDLVRSHGLVPTTMGNYLREERFGLQKLLEALFEEQFDTAEFRKQLKQYQ